jgi:hypothetical protein
MPRFIKAFHATGTLLIVEVAELLQRNPHLLFSIYGVLSFKIKIGNLSVRFFSVHDFPQFCVSVCGYKLLFCML